MSARTEALAQAFRALTLPKAQFTHQAHLRVGLWHVLRYSPDAALSELRERISAFNLANGGTNSATEGYHETITRFYVWQIARFVAEADLTRPEDDLADELVRRYGERDLPMRYWSRERLMSSEARIAWLEPDRAPLPGIGR